MTHLFSRGFYLRNIIRGVFLFWVFISVTYADDASYQIKASYIYNFLQNVTFSKGSLGGSQINVCVVGQNYFGDTLNQIEGSSAPQGTIHISYLGSYSGGAALSSCNVLYLTKSERGNTRSILSSVNTRNVFTIAEYSPFISLGGLVELYIANDKVRFRVNHSLARQANFQLSSQLFQLGR